MRHPLRRLLGAAALASLALTLVPASSAWTVAPPDRPVPADTAAWTTDLVASAPTDALASIPSAAACALGDVNADGIADLAFLGEVQGGRVALEARAGPGFERVLWRLPTSLERTLQCAPDLDLDGTLDPIIRTVGEVQGTAAGAAVDQARNVVQQTLDGATGAAIVGRVDPQSVTGVAADGVEAAQNATAVLLPAAEGALAVLEGSASAATLEPPVPLPVPGLDALDLTASQAATLQVLDITGTVIATVEVAEAGVQPLALSPVQLSGALPDIAVLSRVTGPLEQAAAGVPEVALYAADGTLAWSTQLPPTAGLPILVPNAGDLNLDGVGDLVVTTLEQPLASASASASAAATPAAAYHVLSGVDGSMLFDSGAAVTGLVSALPLGDLPVGPALLEARLEEGASSLTLQALAGTGRALWSADVDALARPVNQVLDPYTGDVLGFSDLTGDAVADVAVAVEQASGDLRLTVLDGVRGDVVWNATVPDASEVLPVVIGPAQLLDANDPDERDDQAAELEGTNRSTKVAELPGLEGLVDGVEEADVGQASLLLAVGNTTSQATLTLLEGTTGEVLWTANATLPDLPLETLVADVAGDLDGDRIQDLLVTATLEGPGDEAPAVVAVVSGATGETVWTNATAASAGDAGLEFRSEFGPASAAASSADAPMLAPVAAASAVLALAALLRRRR